MGLKSPMFYILCLLLITTLLLTRHPFTYERRVKLVGDCDLVVLFTVWRRPEMLAVQLKMLRAQSILGRMKKTCVQIFQNGNHVDVNRVVKEWSSQEVWVPHYVHVVFIHSSVETGYFGRFIVPLTAHVSDDAYFVVTDDDLLWGPRYLENMLRVVDDGYLATRNGRFVNSDGLELMLTQIDSLWARDIHVTFNKDADYDFGGHTWSGKIQWLRDAWTHPPDSYVNCEDFWISAVLKTYYGIRTRSPRCPHLRPEMCSCSHDSAHTHRKAILGNNTALNENENHHIVMRSIIKKYGYVTLLDEEPDIVKKTSSLYTKRVGKYNTSNSDLAVFKNCLFWV